MYMPLGIRKFSPNNAFLVPTIYQFSSLRWILLLFRGHYIPWHWFFLDITTNVDRNHLEYFQFCIIYWRWPLEFIYFRRLYILRFPLVNYLVLESYCFLVVSWRAVFISDFLDYIMEFSPFIQCIYIPRSYFYWWCYSGVFINLWRCGCFWSFWFAGVSHIDDLRDPSYCILVCDNHYQ